MKSLAHLWSCRPPHRRHRHHSLCCRFPLGGTEIFQRSSLPPEIRLPPVRPVATIRAMDIDKVNEAGKAIREAVRSYTHGWPNVEALREITRLADHALFVSGHNAYVSEKASSIKSFAEILYSARRHKKWDQGGSRTGADRIRDILYSDARALEVWQGPISE
jgi:hypothetical protein